MSDHVRAFPSVDTGGGVIRRVLSESPEIMLVEVSFQPHRARISQIHVRADRLTFQPYVPHVFRRQPECEISIGEGKRLLLRSHFEVNAAAGGLNVGKARTSFRLPFCRRRGRHLFNALDQ